MEPNSRFNEIVSSGTLKWPIRFVLLVGLASLVAARWWDRFGHFFPGVWRDTSGMFPPNTGPVALSSLVLLVIAALGYRHLKSIGFWLAMVCVYFSPGLLKPIEPTYQARFKAERSAYKAALSGKGYGAEYSEVIGGRKLTYWRWLAQGIDNGIGIIHDPEGRLSADDEDTKRAFEAQTQGVIFKVVKLEANWYYVLHS